MRRAGGMPGNPWLSFRYALLLGPLGCHNTLGNLLIPARVLPEVKKAMPIREFSLTKTSKMIIQFQLEDT